MNLRPNVLLVFSDQESNHLEWSFLKTPFQNKIKREGVIFSRFYTTSPQCSPARASMLTGLYPSENNVIANVDKVSTGLPLSKEKTVIAGYFKRCGYNTAYFGKWHLGNFNRISEFGFDTHEVKEITKDNDDIVAHKAASWIINQSETPWFACVSFNNPHGIYKINQKPDYPVRDGIDIPISLSDNLSSKPSPQKQYLEKDQGETFKDADKLKWKQYRSYYCDLIELVDKCFGTVLAALDKTNSWENTVIIYTSDHGDLAGAHGMPFKGPCMYEELINVPFYIAWRNHLPAGIENQSLASHVDIVPTVCSLLNIEPDYPSTGQDLIGVIQNKNYGKGRVFFEYTAKQQWVNQIRAVRQGEWKLVHYLNDTDELYKLSDDPYELDNLAYDKNYRYLREELLKLIYEKFNLKNNYTK